MNQTIRWEIPYGKIPFQKLDEYFEQGENCEGSLAVLLLNNESTAIYYVNASQVLLLAANYHGGHYHLGHSEGNHKIIIQNIPERKGPWVLFRPSGSNESTFYLEHLVFPQNMAPEFKEEVDNPLKIKNYYLFRGDPLQIFRDFKSENFAFVDHAMPEKHREILEDFESKHLYNKK